MTARTRCGWATFGECGELLHGRFPLKQKWAVYRSYVRPSIVHGSETWCMKENDMGISWTERSMAKAICRVQLKDRKRSMDFMFMLSETKDQLAMATSIR